MQILACLPPCFSQSALDLVLSFLDIRDQHSEKTLHPQKLVDWRKKVAKDYFLYI